jgi:iron complex outermembrane receptor protein
MVKRSLIFKILCWGLIVFLYPAGFVYAQTTLKGVITDNDTRENLAGVTVVIKGKAAGTSTDKDGKFILSTTLSLPLTIIVNAVGYKPYEQEVTSSGDITIALEKESIVGQEVVVAASRMPERILEAPVSIERMGTAAIQQRASPEFYDALANFKGVESSVQSLTFRSLSTRGFNSNGNVRFNQFIDGVDTQTPGLNFSLGNIAGAPDVDMESAELLPGASSALYGAGGTNGTLLMTTKDPFKYQGLSMSFQTGVNHVDQKYHNRADYRDMSLRYAKAWNNKVAFKVAFSWMEGQDWQADDYSNYDRSAGIPKTGNRNSDPLYDGVNMYGDEPNANYPTLLGVAQAVQTQARTGILAATGNMLDIVARMNAVLPANASSTQIATFVGSLPASLAPSVQKLVPFYFGLRNNLIPNQSVTRTGYEDKYLVDYGSQSIKSSGALHYKLTDKIEAIAQANWGHGTTVYTANNGRISLTGFSIGRYKLELKGDNFFIRGYTTQERSGDSYNATLLGVYLNEYSTPSSTWFPDYTAVYANSKNSGLTDEQANIAARQYADRNRPLPGSPLFETLKKDINSRTVGVAGGAKFNDLSNLYNTEGMYNFSSLLDNKLDLQTGLSYRTFNLHSNGTIFDDLSRNININEFGAFIQAGKKVLNDKLKLNGAIRYDKNENFEGRLTPRISGVYTVAPNKNIRASYQTGFRNPTTQNQYIDIVIGGDGGFRLIGGVPELIDKYALNTNKGYTQSSVNKFKQSGLATDLQLYTFSKFKPESVQAYELGYKALHGNRFLIDAYYFYNSYKNFISTLTLLQPTVTVSPANPLGSARTISTIVNNPETVTAHGAAFGMDYLGRYSFNSNVSYNKLNNSNDDFKSEFNTPTFHVNLGISNREILPRTGFNINYRWQNKYDWSSTFAVGEVKAFSTLDAQINYKLPFYNALIKMGGSNILNKYYITSTGNPSVGGVYYISLLFDQSMR